MKEVQKSASMDCSFYVILTTAATKFATHHACYINTHQFQREMTRPRLFDILDASDVLLTCHQVLAVSSKLCRENEAVYWERRQSNIAKASGLRYCCRILTSFSPLAMINK